MRACRAPRWPGTRDSERPEMGLERETRRVEWGIVGASVRRSSSSRTDGRHGGWPAGPRMPEGAASGRHRDRHLQIGSTGLRVRRHRHRPEQAHTGPRGRRHLVGDRRLPVRPAPTGRGDGRGDEPDHGDRAGAPRRSRRLEPRGSVDSLRGPHASLRRDSRARRRQGDGPHAADVPGAASSPSWSRRASAR